MLHDLKVEFARDRAKHPQRSNPTNSLRGGATKRVDFGRGQRRSPYSDHDAVGLGAANERGRGALKRWRGPGRRQVSEILAKVDAEFGLPALCT
jgi:hypothetical protein